MTAHKTKRRRRFKRRFLQPQPRKLKRRKQKIISENNGNEPDKWNDVIKNISGEGVSNVEKNFFSKGQKFCPVEKDPPIIRMQRELLKFYRNLRLSWVFKDETDKRTDLEKKFYLKSAWEPPKACKEIESMISFIQRKFDKWTPPRWTKDNLSKEERLFLKSLSENEDIKYMWEDKGPSFTQRN